MNGNGVWNTGDQKVYFGAPGRIPVVGDWNGDERTEIGNFDGGVWKLDMDGSGTWNAGDRGTSFGGANHTPVVGKWS
jgi:hypothetical protein